MNGWLVWFALGESVGPIRYLGPRVELFVLMAQLLPLRIFFSLGVRQCLLAMYASVGKQLSEVVNGY